MSFGKDRYAGAMPEIGGEDDSEELTELNDIESVDGIDISMRFVDLTPDKFKKYFRDVVKRYRAKTKKDPKYDLVFLGEEFGKRKEEIIRKLRALKALADDEGRYFGDICVKSNDPEFPSLEPNVFSSNIRFELLRD